MLPSLYNAGAAYTGVAGCSALFGLPQPESVALLARAAARVPAAGGVEWRVGGYERALQLLQRRRVRTRTHHTRVHPLRVKMHLLRVCAFHFLYREMISVTCPEALMTSTWINDRTVLSVTSTIARRRSHAPVERYLSPMCQRDRAMPALGQISSPPWYSLNSEVGTILLLHGGRLPLLVPQCMGVCVNSANGLCLHALPATLHLLQVCCCSQCSIIPAGSFYVTA